MKKLVIGSVLLLSIGTSAASASDVWYDMAQLWSGLASIWYDAAQ